MADLEDLKYKSITDMTPDEAIERLRQIRLSRRTTKTRQSEATQKKKAAAKAMPKVNKQQAEELLKILGGN